MQNRLTDFVFGISIEWSSARQCLVADGGKGKNIGHCGRRRHLQLFRRHVSERPLESRARILIRYMHHAKVDQLHRIVAEDEYIAGFDIAMDQPKIVSGL